MLDRSGCQPNTFVRLWRNISDLLDEDKSAVKGDGVSVVQEEAMSKPNEQVTGTEKGQGKHNIVSYA